MRGLLQVVAVSILALCVLPEVSRRDTVARAQAPASTAASVLAAARTALGGEQRLAAVKNFVATGRTKQVRGDNLVPIEFEIACELPDKFVRKDEIPAQESGPTSTGFNGMELIALPVQSVPPMMPGRAGGAGGPPAAQMDAMRAGRVATAKQDFVRLTLGMFATSFSSYPLTFTYAGQAEAPQGKADVLDVAGEAGFKMRLFINSETHLPIMVSWQAAAGRGMMPGRGPAPTGAPLPPGMPPAGAPPASPAPAQPPAPAPSATPAPPSATPGPVPSAAPPSAPVQGAPPAGTVPPQGAAPGPARGGRVGGTMPAPVEYRVYYGDYREVNGMQWPFRLRRATGAETTEETTFDGFRVNTRIDARKFEIRK